MSNPLNILGVLVFVVIGGLILSGAVTGSEVGHWIGSLLRPGS
jgi:hypothetical protein